MKSIMLITKSRFSLVEVMIVITIIAILTGLVTVALGSGMASRDITRTRGEISKIENSLELYFQKYGTYPVPAGAISSINSTKYEELQKFENFEPIDAWGNAIMYYPLSPYNAAGNYPAGYSTKVAIKIGNQGSLSNATFYNHRSYQLISAGPDGDFGTYPDEGQSLSGGAVDNVTNFQF